VSDNKCIFAGRIGVLGTGALGAFYGAMLTRAGHDVHLLMRRDYEIVLANGLAVKSFLGDFVVHPKVYKTPDDLGPCDLVLIGLKATDNAALPGLLNAVCHNETLVLTLQNGLGNEEAIVSALGGGVTTSSRVLGGIAFLCSNRSADGTIHHMDHGWIKLAEFAGAAIERTHSIAELFRTSGVDCHVYDSLSQARWEKLVWNIPFNGLGVVAKANVAEVLSDPHLRQIAENLMAEVMRAAAVSGDELNPKLSAKMMQNSATMGPYKTSMQIDCEEGRPLEVEAILGEPLRKAVAAGIEVPHLAMLYALVRRANSNMIAGLKGV
jgi:2-dehydropantoate 2-reductase